MDDCIFCSIINRTIPSEIISETDGYIVIHDIAPKAPVHLLVISKKHIPSLNQLTDNETQLVGSMILATRDLARDFGLEARGYRVVINCGKESGQVVPHLHMHFLGGKKMGD